MSDPSEAPRRRRRPQQAPPPAQGSVARGAVLVVIALVIGIVLLRDSSSTPEQQVIGSTATEDGGGGDVDGEGDADSSTTTTTTAPPLLRSEVKVLVANGSGVNGAAGRQTDELEALGYVTGTPTNAERVPATIVHFATGFQAEAEVLATDIGATNVQAMPAVAPVDDLQNAMLLVIVGPDLASGG